MSTLSVQKIYDYYAFCYNLIFGRIFKLGREQSVDLVNRSASQRAKVIEVGVGTGLSLPLYRSDLDISGVDISEKMLQKAKERVVRHHLENIHLRAMDATALDFPNENFDFVVAMYVVSVVPDIQQFLREIARVCKKNGDIIIVNHFISSHPIMRKLEKLFSKAQAFIGFQSDFSIEQILKFPNFKLINLKKTNLFGYWTLLHLKKC